ncbi:MAG: hypothetical protein MGG11_15940 [Trichodesmium sp. MAG_R03]|nr:hypothetical protein [Trichodesmium sp. MAG_R03]
MANPIYEQQLCPNPSNPAASCIIALPLSTGFSITNKFFLSGGNFG